GHYAALGLCETASLAEVRAKGHELAAQAASAAAADAAIWALAVLSEPLSRARYDLALRGLGGDVSGGHLQDLGAPALARATLEEGALLASSPSPGVPLAVALPPQVFASLAAKARAELGAAPLWRFEAARSGGGFWLMSLEEEQAPGLLETRRLLAALQGLVLREAAGGRRLELVRAAAVGLTYGLSSLELQPLLLSAEAGSCSGAGAGALVVNLRDPIVPGQKLDTGGELVLGPELQHFVALSSESAAWLEGGGKSSAFLRPPGRGFSAGLQVTLLLHFAAPSAASGTAAASDQCPR
ncbi:unnamed protein product, partial [Polarella glacialis]